jgi:aryl-alcohol dehydrogenase-like predicted oxidoreductase
VSLYSTDDIDYACSRDDIDGIQVPCNLLEPDPLLARLRLIRSRQKAVIVRSALREGFLTGKYKRDATFPDPNDQRHKWSKEQIAKTVDLVEQFRFLESDAGSMILAAARYPLSFPEVSTVVLGTKSVSQAESNFGAVPDARLTEEALDKIRERQLELGLGDRWPRLLRRLGIS